jgi:hypothetical protein
MRNHLFTQYKPTSVEVKVSTPPVDENRADL